MTGNRNRAGMQDWAIADEAVRLSLDPEGVNELAAVERPRVPVLSAAVLSAAAAHSP